MPSATQDLDGIVTVSLGAKGIVELELVASGEKWGRGPAKDIHSSLKAMVDSPAWRLVKALDTLVSEDGNTITIENYPKPRPLSDEEKAMIAAAAKRRSEAQAKKQLGVQHWIDDLPWRRRTSGWSRSRRSTSRAWSAATPDRAARRSCRIARRRRSTCAWCPT